MKKAVPTTSQLELIKNFKFKITDIKGQTKSLDGEELDRDIDDEFLKILNLIEQFYKLSKTTKFKYGKPVDEFDLNKVFKDIFLEFEPATGIYYNPMFVFKPMGLSYLISFIMTVRHERDIAVDKHNKGTLIILLRKALNFVQDALALGFSGVGGLPVITVKGENFNIDVERFEEKEETNGEGLSYLFDASKVSFRYKDLSPHFTKYIVNVISKQIRRMAKRGEIDVKRTEIESDTGPLLRGGRVIRRSKGGQPITAKVQANFLRAVLDDLLYNEGGEDIVRQIASLDKKEFDEFMRNKKYNRSLTTIFTQFVNVAIKENLNKIGYYDVVAQKFRGDSSLVAKSNVTKNFFDGLDLTYNVEAPLSSFKTIVNSGYSSDLRSFLRKQIPVSVLTVELDIEPGAFIVSPIFQTYAETDSVSARTKFILDFSDQRIYYNTSHYISNDVSTPTFKQISSSISMDIDDPLRDLISLLGQMTKPDEVSSRTFAGKNEIPELKSIGLLKSFIDAMPKKNIIKIEGPEYNSLLGTITGGMLLGVYNRESTILNSLTYLSFDSIRNRRRSKGMKNICMVRLYVDHEDYGDVDRYFLLRGGSNCIFSDRDLSTGDTVASVVATIVDSLRADPEDYTLSGPANVTAGFLFPYQDRHSVQDSTEKLTKEILKIPLKDMDDLLFGSGRIELKITDEEDKNE